MTTKLSNNYLLSIIAQDVGNRIIIESNVIILKPECI